MKKSKIIARSIEIFTAFVGMLMAFVGKNFIIHREGLGETNFSSKYSLPGLINETKSLNVLRFSSVMLIVSLIVLFIIAVWFILAVVAEATKNKKIADPLNALSLITTCYFAVIMFLIGLGALFTSSKDGLTLSFGISFKSVFTYLYIVGSLTSIGAEIYLLKTEE